MRFDWDKAKAERNRQKHGVAFIEAATIWGDSLVYVTPDPNHSQQEDRYLSIGHSDRGRLLIVSHTYREGGEVNRIINARKLTNQERQDHERRIIDHLRGEPGG